MREEVIYHGLCGPDCSANTRCRNGIWKTNLCPQATEMRAISTSSQTRCGDPCNFQLLLARLELNHLPLKGYISCGPFSEFCKQFCACYCKFFHIKLRAAAARRSCIALSIQVQISYLKQWCLDWKCYFDSPLFLVAPALRMMA